MAILKGKSPNIDISKVKLLEEAQVLVSGGFWYWDIDNAKVEFSNHVFNQLGFETKNSVTSFERIIGFIHSDEKHILQKAINELLEGVRESNELEFRAKTKDGEWKWFLGRAAVVSKKSNGKASLIVGTTIDISHQKELLQKLEVSQYRLNKTQKIAHIGSWECDPINGINYWSDETYRIFGLKKDRIKPNLESIKPFMNADDLAVLNKKFEDIYKINERSLFNINFKYNGPDTVEKNIRITIEVERDNQNKILRWHGVVNDITTDVINNKRLKEDKDNLMALVRNLPAMVFATGHNGEIVFWNKACENITGYKSKEIIGNKNALKLLYPDSDLRKRVKKQLVDMSSTLSSWEHQITRKNNEKRDIFWTAFSDFVKIEGWNAVAIGYDLTLQRNTERIQNHYQHKLEALAQTATELVGLPLTESIYHYVGTQLEKFAPSALHTVISFEPEKKIVNVEA